jgi:sporulation and spore germination protein/immunoglobulin-like protein involved in spore germination
MRWILPIVVVAIVVAGCGSSSESSSTVTGPTTTESAATTGTETTTGNEIQLRVYFLRDGVVAPVARDVPATRAVARAALEQLIAGITAQDDGLDLTSDVPADTEVNGITIAGGTATVDLSQSFAEGAEASLSSRLAQVVYTLTQFPTVDAVAFEVDGKPMTTVTDGEGMLIDHPASRSDYESLTPAILVESPLPKGTVSAPITIRGTANTFEATFQVEVLDEAGVVVGKRFVTATSGNGQRGTFRADVKVAAGPGPIRLVVYEDSAESGKRIHEVEIPLKLAG